ncbi:MAG: hypothetical protein FIA97_04430, partial [Methylococcaceae bacterium]|nr:hypothetical protein [Methylococcaceae bacterium]
MLLPVLWDSAEAGEIYRCVVDGKTTYTQAPPEGGDCRPARLPMADPSPDEVARALERKEREKAAEEAAQAEARERQKQELELRAVQAREREAAAAERRARAVEEQVRQSQQPPPVPYGQTYYPIIVPGVPSGQLIPPEHHPHPDHPLPPAPDPQ